MTILTFCLNLLSVTIVLNDISMCIMLSFRNRVPICLSVTLVHLRSLTEYVCLSGRDVVSTVTARPQPSPLSEKLLTSTWLRYRYSHFFRIKNGVQYEFIVEVSFNLITNEKPSH